MALVIIMFRRQPIQNLIMTNTKKNDEKPLVYTGRPGNFKTDVFMRLNARFIASYRH